jgi:hypothetical protein
MKTSIKFATGLILAAAALVASGSAAFAGEGGAAGSVGIKFNNTVTTFGTGTTAVTFPDVRSISSSVAVGKNSAAAAARTNGDTFSSAVGNSSALTLSAATDSSVGYAITADAAFGTAQLNGLSVPPTGTVNLGPNGIVIP